MQLKQGLRLFQRQSFCFSKLSNIFEDTELKSQFEVQYKKMVQTNKLTEKGLVKFHPEQFAQLVNLIQSENDAKMGTQAYYNFLGNLINIPLSTQDKFFLKCIEYNQQDFVLSIFQHQRTLFYFPAHKVTDQLLNKIINDQEKSINLMRSLKRNLTIQISAEKLLWALDQFYEKNNYHSVILTYQSMRGRKLILPVEFLPKVTISMYKKVEDEKIKIQQKLAILISDIQNIFENKDFTHSQLNEIYKAQVIGYATLGDAQKTLIILAKLLKGQPDLSDQIWVDTIKEILPKLVDQIGDQPELLDRLYSLSAKLAEQKKTKIKLNQIRLQIHISLPERPVVEVTQQDSQN